VAQSPGNGGLSAWTLACLRASLLSVRRFKRVALSVVASPGVPTPKAESQRLNTPIRLAEAAPCRRDAPIALPSLMFAFLASIRRTEHLRNDRHSALASTLAVRRSFERRYATADRRRHPVERAARADNPD
jgi:hypothetical protein